MAVILVSLPVGSPATLKNAVNQLVVVATDATEAKLIAGEYAHNLGFDGAKAAFGAADTQTIGAGEGVWAESTKVNVFSAAVTTASSD
jgi:hypothetical protein